MVYNIPYTPNAQGTRRTKVDHSVNIRWHQMLAQAYARARESQELYGIDENDEGDLSDDPYSPNFNDSQKAVESYLEYLSALPRRYPVNMPAKSVPNVEEEIPEFPTDTPSASSTPQPNRRWRRYLSINSAVVVMSPTKLLASAMKRTRSLPELGLKGRSPFVRLRRRGTVCKSSAATVPKEEGPALTRVASEPRAQTQTPVPAIVKKARRNTVDDGQTCIARVRRVEFATPTFVNTSATHSTPRKDSESSESPKRKRPRRERSKSSPPRPPKPAPKVEPEPFQIRPMLLPSSVFETTATCPYSIRQSPIPADMWDHLSSAGNTHNLPNIEASIEDEPYQEPWWVTPSVIAVLFIVVVLIIGLCLASIPVWAVCAPCGWVYGLFPSALFEIEDEKRSKYRY
ncbi:hypothetical protein Moror_15598 [Moniliophthora roreri MCA 2997]|uniref:Uncharacterized protein n=1 Tax=Moniliophthora roreri (strain MCA 2997) TaxID=1381753 RepID=V2XVJ7_MONRO|nr:hypothetical protein Moror_15598 [Moniliophthora roreri MCA 2997]